MSCDVRENSEKRETECWQELQAPFLHKDETSDQDVNNISPEVSSKINASEDFMGQETQLSPKETVNYDEEQSVAYLRSAEQREFDAQLVRGYYSRVKTRQQHRHSARSSRTVSPYTNVHTVQDHNGKKYYYEQSVIGYKDVVTRQPQTSSHGSNNPIQTTFVYVDQNSQNIYKSANVTNYTSLSVFVIMCCCMPLGIRALIKARDAKSFLMVGRRQKAVESANTSRNLNIAGMIIGPLLTVLFVVLQIYVFNSHQEFE